MGSKFEPNYDWRKWRLIIAEEFEHWHLDGFHEDDGHTMCGRYPVCSFVYLWNNTIQIVVPCGDMKTIYEVDLDRCDKPNWLEHLSHKVWSTADMIIGLASAARRIGKLRGVRDKKFYDYWSVEAAMSAAEHIRDCEQEDK